MDALAIEVIVEARAECSDADRARAALSEALLAARAPAHGGKRPGPQHPPRATAPSGEGQTASTPHWTVTMTVTGAASGGGLSSAAAVIVDDAGSIVAQRTLTDRGARTCLPLARAVGTWASLVLDAEMNRAKDDDGRDAHPARTELTSGVAGPAALGILGGAGSAPVGDFASVSEGEAARPVERRAIDLGMMMYLRNGMAATGGIGGLAPFVTIEVSPSWVLRPGLFFGRSTERVPVTARQMGSLSHLGARFDFCRRIPGNYIERRGIEADLCAGLEGGVVTGDRSAEGMPGRLGAGPSANLRGELGAGLALEVRGLVGANILAFAPQSPLVFASAELGMSVRLP